MKFVIDRSKWLRGEGPEVSYLRRKSDQKMCCLGFFLEACGVPTSLLLGKQYPTTDLPPAAAWLSDAEDHFPCDGEGPRAAATTLLATTNDSRDPQLTETEREARIKTSFAWRGVEVQFVG